MKKYFIPCFTRLLPCFTRLLPSLKKISRRVLVNARFLWLPIHPGSRACGRPSLARIAKLPSLLGLTISLTFPTLVSGDAGVSISYRSVPILVPDNGAAAPTRRSLNMMTLNFYLDDSLRGRTNKAPAYWVEEVYIKEYEPPSDKYPVGRMIEKRIDIGDVSVEEINEKNKWRDGVDGNRIPKVYKKKIRMQTKTRGWLPGWLNPNIGAGYIGGVNISYAIESMLVSHSSIDLYIGKRLFILPHLFHVYFKVGPSISSVSWEDQPKMSSISYGGFYNIGFQFLVLKGIKIFTEMEFRNYVSAEGVSGGDIPDVTFINVLPPTGKNYYRKGGPNGNVGSREWARDLITQGLRMGVKFSF